MSEIIKTQTILHPNKVVPPETKTARLTFFASAVMAFLGVFSCVAALIANKLAYQWQDALSEGATIRISAPDDQIDIQTKAVLSLLRTTQGISEAHLIDGEEQKKLLEPWFGEGIPIDTLPLPRLIALKETPEGFDSTGLRMRLSAEAPGAILEDHQRWQRPVVIAAERLRSLGLFCLTLIGGTIAIMINLAANASLSANLPVIRTLRLIGAKDTYIIRAFVRRFTVTVFWGASSGVMLGLLCLFLFFASPREGSDLLAGINPLQGGGVFLTGLIPPLAGLIAFIATRRSTVKKLNGLT